MQIVKIECKNKLYVCMHEREKKMHLDKHIWNIWFSA